MLAASSFLDDLAFAEFKAEIRANEERIAIQEASLRYDRSRQSFMSSLMVLLEIADLSRKELHFVLNDVQEATPDQLLEKIQWVSDRLGEHPDPKRQFVLRSKIL